MLAFEMAVSAVLFLFNGQVIQGLKQIRIHPSDTDTDMHFQEHLLYVGGYIRFLI